MRKEKDNYLCLLRELNTSPEGQTTKEWGLTGIAGFGFFCIFEMKREKKFAYFHHVDKYL